MARNLRSDPHLKRTSSEPLADSLLAIDPRVKLSPRLQSHITKECATPQSSFELLILVG
jgi:hypothetical protein